MNAAFVSHRCLSAKTLNAAIARRTFSGTGLPGDRLPILRRLLDANKDKRVVRILETHNGLTGIIAESVKVNVGGQDVEFDGMWSSSLTASAAEGKPDIETVDTSARLARVRETLDVTSKPLIYDADTGGQPEIFRFTVRSLEKLGVSMAIIEDKAGLKQNSLFGTDRVQQLETIENFTAKIKAGQEAKLSPDFMIAARMESLIAGHGQAEALKRAVACTEAGADAIMIHSKEKSPAEVLEFLNAYHTTMGADALPVVAVPTTYNSITEAELKDAGVSICIYANHMLRAAYPSMVKTAESILLNSRSLEADDDLLPVKKVITMIDENPMNATNAMEPSKKGGGGSVGAAANPSATRSFGTLAKAAAEAVSESSVVADVAAELTSRSKPGLSEAEIIAKTAPAKESVPPVDMYEHVRAAGINYFCGVPDSLLKPFCAVVAERAESHLIAANEGAAVSAAAGYYLATGETPLVYLQNSGLGNAVNPIMSLAHGDVYGIPMVLVIGWRGCPGHKDEPQHVVQGRQMIKQLESLGIDIVIMPNEADEAKGAFDDAVAAAERTSQPVALLVPPKTFMSYKAAKKTVPAAPPQAPTREEAIGAILADLVGPEDAVVSTTGFTSREVYELRANLGQSHEQDFLCVGSMGHALAIAQGIATAQPDRTVWCLDGDGASLMHLGNMASSGALMASSPNGLSNLRHVVLNNRVHDSVGSQPTAASFDGAVDFPAMALASGYASSVSASTVADIRPAVEEALAKAPNGPLFLCVDLKLGTRSDLGRPKTTTHEAKEAFMKFLNTDDKLKK